MCIIHLMMVKSVGVDDHARDLEETFGTMRKYGMHLNPLKCIFGVNAGMFLGYTVIERGIEVNPSKVAAIRDLKPPANLNEVHVLAGKILSLNHFISRLAKKSLPFFKILLKAGSFEWTHECQSAFKQLKEFLITLPLLKQPIVGQPFDNIFSGGRRVGGCYISAKGGWRTIAGVFYKSGAPGVGD